MKVLCPKPSVKSETHGNATLSDFCGGGGVCGGGSNGEELNGLTLG